MLEKAMREAMLADEALSGLVADRVYYQFPEQDAGYPRVTLTRIHTERQVPFDGPDTLATARVQVDCWALNEYAAAKDVAEALRNLLHGFRGTLGDAKIAIQIARIENEQDDKRPPASGSDDMLFRVIQDWRIWFEEPMPTWSNWVP